VWPLSCVRRELIGNSPNYPLVNVAWDPNAPVRPLVHRLWPGNDQHSWLIFKHHGNGLTGETGQVGNLGNGQGGLSERPANLVIISRCASYYSIHRHPAFPFHPLAPSCNAMRGNQRYRRCYTLLISGYSFTASPSGIVVRMAAQGVSHGTFQTEQVVGGIIRAICVTCHAGPLGVEGAPTGSAAI
jgi:hypothetical protein